MTSGRNSRHYAPLAMAITAAIALASFAGPALAEPPPSPGPWLRSTVERVRKLVTRQVKADTPEEEKWKKEVKSTVDDILDWPELTQRTLGRYWAERTTKERDQFSRLLREMIEASYQSKLRLAARDQLNKPKDVTIEWTKEEVKSSTSAEAIAKVTADKSKVDLLFRLKWDGKKWRVWDLAIDDVSNVNVYRKSFGKIINDRGFPALLERLNRKVAEIRSGKADIAP